MESLEGHPMADILPTRPARSGRTGQRPFGSLGEPIEVERYDELFQKKVADVKVGAEFPMGSGWIVIRHQIEDEADWECVDDAADVTIQATDWGKVIGHGLRSVQFHSTLSGQLMVCPGSTISAQTALSVAPAELVLRCLAYYDPRVQSLKRGQVLPEEAGFCQGRKSEATFSSCLQAYGYCGRIVVKDNFEFTLGLCCALFLYRCISSWSLTSLTAVRCIACFQQDGDSFESSSQGKAWLAAAAEFKALLPPGEEALAATESELRNPLLELALPAGQRCREIGTPSQDSAGYRAVSAVDFVTLDFLVLEGQVQCCWNSIVEAGRWMSVGRRLGLFSLSSLGSLDQGGNNTVAVAPGFGEVRAVEINKRLAEAAEDGFELLSLGGHGQCSGPMQDPTGEF
eukprot:Skav222417  [mRNA]  locus=scaffold2890:58049:63365:+ [translate_table: standard]